MAWRRSNVRNFANLRDFANLDMRNRTQQRLPTCRKLCTVRNQHDDGKNASPGQTQRTASLQALQEPGWAGAEADTLRERDLHRVLN
jgi:hypothetical protein